MSISVATIGLDRFAGLANWRGRTAGKVVTKPLPITRTRLEINLEALEAIPPRVALLAEDGSPLPATAWTTTSLNCRRAISTAPLAGATSQTSASSAAVR
jgi:hypothetical protein